MINITLENKIENVGDLNQYLKKTLDSSITEVVQTLLGGAISLNASDIHIEPQKEKTVLRVRLDGMLQELIDIPKSTYEELLSRLKLISGVKINVTDRPQDGRFSVSFKGSAVEIRLSTLPAEYGEAVVARILNPKNLISIEELGLRDDLLKVFLKEIKRPNGMIIVTGPTGSGKTTTLYAFLKAAQKPEVKIITIEDPIEYHLKGVSQTQVDPKKGYSFSSGLKAIVRQDPDIILVGEMRDSETVNIALQAALTGHLVFTTLHTNDAAGTIARLTSLGAKPENISPALNLIIAQRLVRKICKKCALFSKPTKEELRKIATALKGSKIKIKKNLKIAKTKGCKDCNFTGYRGRIGIFEGLVVDDDMEKLILKKPSIAQLREEAKKKGMLTLRQDGFLKVLQQITTIEEVERVTGE